VDVFAEPFPTTGRLSGSTILPFRRHATILWMEKHNLFDHQTKVSLFFNVFSGPNATRPSHTHSVSSISFPDVFGNLT
jgi:hypothetical protein